MTPATSSKVLFHHSIESDERNHILQFMSNLLKNITINYKFSSVNVNFMLRDETTLFCDSDFSLRETIQYR